MQSAGGTLFLPLLLSVQCKSDLSTALFQVKDGARLGEVTCSELWKHQAHPCSHTLLQVMEPSTSLSYEQRWRKLQEGGQCL